MDDVTLVSVMAISGSVLSSSNLNIYTALFLAAVGGAEIIRKSPHHSLAHFVTRDYGHFSTVAS